MSKENKVKVIFEAVIDKYRKNVKDAVDETLKLGDSGKKASEGINFDESTKSAYQLDDGLKKVGRTLKTLVVGYAGKKLFDAGLENVKQFVDYEDHVTDLNIMLKDLSKDAKEAVVEDLKDISLNLRQMPNEVMSSAYDALSASVPVERLNEFMEVATKTRIGGSTSMETAVDGLTSIVNTYGEEVISYTEASDLMFTTMEEGKASIDGIASNLYSVLPPAKMLEVPFYNITGALATLTATGTPVAQATTQIGRMFTEFSKEGTKASKTLNHITGKNFKELIKEGYNLQDILMILDKYANSLGVEINNLFNTSEAGNAAASLTSSKEKFTSDLQAMQDSAGATENAFKEKASGIKYAIDGIKSKWELFKVSIGETYSESLDGSLERLNTSLENAAQDGSLDSLAQSIGNLMASVINQIDNLVNNLDRIISAIDKVTSFINNNLPGATRAVKLFFKAWVGYKVISFASNAILGFDKNLEKLLAVIKPLSKITPHVTGAFSKLFGLLKANPIVLVIAAVVALIGWLFKLKLQSEGYHNWLLAAFEMTKLGFKLLVKVILTGLDFILRKLAELTKNIPLVGKAFEGLARVSGSALNALNSSIDGSIARIQALQYQAAQGVHIRYTQSVGGSSSMLPNNLSAMHKEVDISKLDPKDPNYFQKVAQAKQRNEQIKKERARIEQEKKNRQSTKVPSMDMSGFNFTPAPVKSPSNAGSGVGSPKPQKKTIHDRIRDIEEKHSPDQDLYESRAELADKKGDSAKAKANRKSLIASMKREVEDLLRLENRSSGDDKKIVEAARNNLLIKIEETLEDINGTLGELVGDFNIPSNLKALTEYQYKVQTASDSLAKRLIYSPNIKMYLTIDDLEGKGVRQVQQEVENFTNAVFEDKNDLVSKFVNDVTRN